MLGLHEGATARGARRALNSPRGSRGIDSCFLQAECRPVREWNDSPTMKGRDAFTSPECSYRRRELFARGDALVFEVPPHLRRFLARLIHEPHEVLGLLELHVGPK